MYNFIIINIQLPFQLRIFKWRPPCLKLIDFIIFCSNNFFYFINMFESTFKYNNTGIFTITSNCAL